MVEQTELKIQDLECSWEGNMADTSNNNQNIDPTAGLQVLGQLIGQGASWARKNVLPGLVQGANGMAQQFNSDLMAPAQGIASLANGIGAGFTGNSVSAVQGQQAQNDFNNNQAPLTASQQMALDSIKKAHQKNLDASAAALPLAVTGKVIDATNPSNSSQQSNQNNQNQSQGQQQSSQNQPQPVMNQKTGAPSDVNQVNDPLMNTVTNQANNVLTRKNSLLENLIPGLRGAHDTNQLGRLTMAAGIGDKRAAVDMQNMKNLGQEPIQPEQYMTAYSGMYQKTIDGLSQVATNAASGADTGLKLFTETSDNTRNAFQKMMAQPSDASSAALTNAVAQQKAQLAATMDFHDYIKNNPINKVMDNIKANLPKANNKDAQASAMAGRVGKYSFK